MAPAGIVTSPADSQIINTDFINCNLSGTSFIGAVIDRMMTSSCNFTDVDFTDAIVNGLGVCKVPQTVHWSVWESMGVDAQEEKKEIKPI